jgi:Tfp pilus assembly protein PilN
MAAPDLRRMLAFDIDRLSPLAPELIHFDAEIVERDIGEGRQQVLMGVVPRGVVAELLETAERDGLVPAAVGVRAESEGATTIRYDFLPEARPGAKTGLSLRYWWGAVAALFVLNLAVLVGRDMAATAQLQAAVDAKAPMVNAALALRRHVEGEERRRAELIARGQRAEPLRVLDAATRALSDGAWVRRLEWNGQTLHLAGYRKTGLDVGAALRASGVFLNPRTQAPEGGASAAEAPFDIAVDARPGVRR